MSTSFPNSNGNVPPYNPQANGSFNQYPPAGPPPGAYPPMEQFHHNMYPPNGYGGMPPGPPNMGGPGQQAPPPQQKAPQQYPGAGAGVKLPAYDGSSMQNGYMGYLPQHQRPPGAPQNGPPPNYNAHPQMAPQPNNPYGAVPDPYRMYPPMPAPPASTAPSSSSQQRPPSQSNSVPSQPAPPPNQANPHQYPSQQPLPAHLHGGPPYHGMAPGNAPLQHYQPPAYNNGTTAARPPGGQTFPPLQPSKQAKQEEARPNNMPGSSNQQFPGNYNGTNSSSGFDSFGPPPGGYPGYGAPPHGSTGAPGNSSAHGMNGASSTPGSSGSFGYNPGLYGPPGQSSGGHSTPNHNAPNHSASGHHTPVHPSPGHQTPTHQTSGHNSGQNTPSAAPGPSGNPFGPMGSQGSNQGHFGNNDSSSNQGTPGGYGAMHASSTPTSSDHGTLNHVTPNTPGTPGSHGGMGSSSTTPLSHQKPPQQPGMQNHMPPPPQYNQNTMMSPSHGPNGTPQKHPTPTGMGSSLPPLNGQYPPLSHSMPSPANPPSEPTFKEPAMPIRHSPSHLQSPAHQPPSGAPPAYNAPSSSTRTPDATTSSQPTRTHSPTFAVPTLPAAATLAQASSANQVSTKPKTSPQKKRADDGIPEPPTQDTPFTLVTHYELPAAMTVLKDTLTVGPKDKVHPHVDKQYFSRKRQQLRVPYPEGANAQNAVAKEPDTFGFMQGTKYFDPKYNRGIQPTGPPILSRSQSMHSTMVSPSFNSSQPSTSGRQPAKKARSASDASEPTFNMPLPPSKQPQMRPTDPRQMQQMQQMQQYQHQMHMQKLHQQQMAAQQQHMARMAQAGPSTSSAGVPPVQPTPLPPLAPPALQRAESMPQLPSQQPTMGGMPPHATHNGAMPPMNGTEGPTDNRNTGHLRMGGLPPLTLGNPGQDGVRNHDRPSTSSQEQVYCAGCHIFVSPGSPTVCCMYHSCKNVYHQECTRLSTPGYSIATAPLARWVCPTCEVHVRPMQMQHA